MTVRRLIGGLIALSMVSACGPSVALDAQRSPSAAVGSDRVVATAPPRPTPVALCAGLPNPQRVEGGSAVGMIQTGQDYVGAATVEELYSATAFSLLIPGQATWAEVTPDTVLGGGVTRIEELHLMKGTRVLVTICFRAWDYGRTIAGNTGFHRLAAIAPLR